MNKLAEVLGFDRNKLWWYRDIALIMVAAVAALWGVSCLYLVRSDFNTKVGISSVIVSIICCAISPNRPLLFCAVFTIVAASGWLALVVTRDSQAGWIAISATAAAVVMFRVFRKRPLKH
jgi:hypothetical protein